MKIVSVEDFVKEHVSNKIHLAEYHYTILRENLRLSGSEIQLPAWETLSDFDKLTFIISMNDMLLEITKRNRIEVTI